MRIVDHQDIGTLAGSCAADRSRDAIARAVILETVLLIRTDTGRPLEQRRTSGGKQALPGTLPFFSVWSSGGPAKERHVAPAFRLVGDSREEIPVVCNGVMPNSTRPLVLQELWNMWVITPTQPRWWCAMGQEKYPQAQQLLITADSGGSNGTPVRLWKLELHHRRYSAGIKVLRGWRKFICAGTTFTVSGTKKSLPTLELLFLNSA